MAAFSTGTRPKVALLSHRKQSFFDEHYASLTTALRDRAEPTIVLATDEALTDGEFADVRRHAFDYVAGGGTMVFMGHFPSFVLWRSIRYLFFGFGLPWKSGDYHRTTFHVNPSTTRVDTSALDPSYSQKATHLQNVARGDAIYLASNDSQTQSMVLAPHSIDTTQTPAALGVSGRGKVGYLGDVNAEAGTDRLVLALCGVAAG